VQKNYDKMEQAGIIKGATIHINYKSFGCKAVADMLIIVDPLQEDQLSDRLRKNPGIYGVYGKGPKGYIGVVTALKTLQQLDEVKSIIRHNFLVSEIKTSIWTDVREMHGNLLLCPEEESNSQSETEKTPIFSNTKIVIDEIDEKIAEKLSEDGRAPLGKIAKEIGISADTVKRRYEKLKKNGVLKVTIQIDPIRIGYRAAAIFFAVTSNEKSSTIIEKISRMPDVISIMKTTGDYDLKIWKFIRDIDQLLETQLELVKIQGIAKMDVEIVGLPNKWPGPRQYISTF
jgi:DNA-binding Lrp family transcriptional regulator